jgi:hypothetical protein
MKITIFNGSPRKQNTAAMVDAFAQGAKEAGHEIEILHVGKMKIAGCLGCEYCHTKGEGKCIQKDDMDKVMPAYLESDMSFPIFHPFRPFHFMHPQLLVCPESSLSSDTTTLFPQLHRHAHVRLKSPLVWSFASDGDRTVRRPYLFPIRFGGVP